MTIDITTIESAYGREAADLVRQLQDEIARFVRLEQYNQQGTPAIKEMFKDIVAKKQRNLERILQRLEQGITPADIRRQYNIPDRPAAPDEGASVHPLTPDGTPREGEAHTQNTHDPARDPNAPQGAPTEGDGTGDPAAAAQHAEQEAVREEVRVEEEALKESKKEIDALVKEIEKDIAYFKNLGKLAYAAVRGAEALQKKLQEYDAQLQFIAYSYEVPPPLEQRLKILESIRNYLTYFRRMIRIDTTFVRKESFFFKRVIEEERLIEQDERDIMVTLQKVEEVSRALAQHFSNLNESDPHNPLTAIVKLRTELEGVTQEQLLKVRIVLEAAKEIKKADDAIQAHIDDLEDALPTVRMAIETKRNLTQVPQYTLLKNLSFALTQRQKLIETQVLAIRNERELLEQLEHKSTTLRQLIVDLLHRIEQTEAALQRNPQPRTAAA